MEDVLPEVYLGDTCSGNPVFPDVVHMLDATWWTTQELCGECVERYSRVFHKSGQVPFWDRTRPGVQKPQNDLRDTDCAILITIFDHLRRCDVYAIAGYKTALAKQFIVMIDSNGHITFPTAI